MITTYAHPTSIAYEPVRSDGGLVISSWLDIRCGDGSSVKVCLADQPAGVIEAVAKLFPEIEA